MSGRSKNEVPITWIPCRSWADDAIEFQDHALTLALRKIRIGGP
jgi:hypothetical protein